MSAENPALALYAAHGAALAARYETVAPAQLFAPVADLLPPAPARVADLGAGSGRDAAWFAGQGHQVTAVEPVAELREAARHRHAGAGIDWVADQLPGLAGLDGRSFDLLLLIAVWHHLDTAQRAEAMVRLHDLSAESARVVLSLRHGPEQPESGAFAPDVEGTIRMAEAKGFTLLRRVEAEAQQRQDTAGINWTWLVLAA
ncbi:class I SAM-dependent methyltransferase [Paracoccus zhejiangensis]|uniref:SAM-dependent methyltransferase n=1 Tax=Paracoccus zhejiangensis TaxID=1077935 RepID=A0A2H5EUA8_9RHOB|nr:class I SAM-dependent methyltransferase [Paracoccus zhejiangensis]AUH62880.1 SAM-dependent methyltransferase [Paracoccus zhejiangensis]